MPEAIYYFSQAAEGEKSRSPFPTLPGLNQARGVVGLKTILYCTTVVLCPRRLPLHTRTKIELRMVKKKKKKRERIMPQNREKGVEENKKRDNLLVRQQIYRHKGIDGRRAQYHSSDTDDVRWSRSSLRHDRSVRREQRVNTLGCP